MPSVNNINFIFIILAKACVTVVRSIVNKVMIFYTAEIKKWANHWSFIFYDEMFRIKNLPDNYDQCQNHPTLWVFYSLHAYIYFYVPRFIDRSHRGRDMLMSIRKSAIQNNTEEHNTSRSTIAILYLLLKYDPGKETMEFWSVWSMRAFNIIIRLV